MTQQYTYIALPINQALLDQQITALGIAGYQGVNLPTPNATVTFANPISLEDQARLTAVMQAHNASQRTATQQSDDAQDATDHATLADIRTQLQTYIDTPNASLTNAMVMNTLRLVCRVLMYVTRRGVRLGWL